MAKTSDTVKKEEEQLIYALQKQSRREETLKMIFFRNENINIRIKVSNASKR